MNVTSWTDGNGTVTYQAVFSDPNNPYHPSSTTDGNGNTTHYTWDSFGNLRSVTTARGTTTTRTFSSAAFGLGELVMTKTGAKAPTTFTYLEPSGLVHTTAMPLP